MEDNFLIGSHVSLNNPEFLLGSAKQANKYDANVFSVYTGSPHSAQRLNIDKLKIPEAKSYMKDHHLLNPVVIHAPYIINLGNTKKASTFHFSKELLKREIKRAESFGAKQLVLHPGAHVGMGKEAGIKQIIKGLNEVLTPDQTVKVSLETMAGKGTEIGSSFAEIADIIKGVKLNDKLSVTFDTCHVSDAGYDIKNNFKGVLKDFDEKIGLNRLGVVHLNDSKNEPGSHKDRHETIGLGKIGFEPLNNLAHYKPLKNVPKIMETPEIALDSNKTKETVSPHPLEINMLKKQKFDNNFLANLKTYYATQQDK